MGLMLQVTWQLMNLFFIIATVVLIPGSSGKFLISKCAIFLDFDVLIVIKLLTLINNLVWVITFSGSLFCVVVFFDFSCIFIVRFWIYIMLNVLKLVGNRRGVWNKIWFMGSEFYLCCQNSCVVDRMQQWFLFNFQ